MLRLLLAVLLGISGTPVLAQDTPTADLLALAMVGIADGATVTLGDLQLYTVRKIKPGEFHAIGTGKKRALLTFAELEDCVVEISAKFDPPQLGRMRIDARLLTGITFEPASADQDVPGWRVVVTAAEGGLVATRDGESDSQLEMSNVIHTSVTREEMEAAAAELIGRCGGHDVPLADASPVDLLAMIFAGLAPGVPVQMNGLEGPAEREFDGFYTIKPATGEPAMRLSVQQQGRCRFLFTAGQEGDRQFAARLDASLISTITVEPQDDGGSLAAYKVTIEGEADRLMTQEPDGSWVVAPSAESTLTTGLGIDDIEAAIAAFRTEYCPGLAG